MNSVKLNLFRFISLSCIALGTMTVMVSACKKAKDSNGNVKGVENLARAEGAKLTSPICGATTIDAAQEAALDEWLSTEGMVSGTDANGDAIDSKSAIVKELKRGLAFAPLKLIKLLKPLNVKVNFKKGQPECPFVSEKDQKFFSDFTGRKSFTCAGKFAGQNSFDVHFGSIETDADLEEALKAYSISENKPSKESFVVRHESVRVIAVVYTRLMRGLVEAMAKETAGTALVQDPAVAADVQSTNASITDALKEFEDARTLLADAFMSDVSNSKMFPDTKVLDMLKKTREELGEAHFKDFVFAEVMDSYYCNAASYSNLSNFYQGTLNVFNSEYVDSGFGKAPYASSEAAK